MFRFEIPKEIKTQVRLLGLELKEWAVIGIVVVFSLTVFSDMIHKIFVVPFYILVALSILYLFSPSPTNPQRKNYHSLFYFLKRERGGYFSVNNNRVINQQVKEMVFKNNQHIANELDKASSHLNDVEDSRDGVFSQVEYRDGSYYFVDDEKESDVEIDMNEDDHNPIIDDLDSVKSVKRNVSQLKKGTDDEVSFDKESNKIYLPIEEDDSNMTLQEYEQEKKGRDNEKMRFPSKFPKWITIVAVLLLVVGGLFMFTRFDDKFLAKEDEFIDEEVLVSALRSFSLKDYDEAMLLFDEIDYEALEDDDKDVMLLTYLFGDSPEVAIELEPNFDEVVVSYYKASFSMQKIRDLSEVVDSKVLDFEVAVSDEDYEKVVELKEFVKLKDERGEQIVEALLETNQVDEAKLFIEEIEDENLKMNLELMVEESEIDKKAKNKKKIKKGDK